MLTKVLEDFPAVDGATRKAIEQAIQARFMALGYLALERQRYDEAKAWFRQGPLPFRPANVGGLIAATMPPAYRLWRHMAGRPLKSAAAP